MGLKKTRITLFYFQLIAQSNKIQCLKIPIVWKYVSFYALLHSSWKALKVYNRYLISYILLKRRSCKWKPASSLYTVGNNNYLQSRKIFPGTDYSFAKTFRFHWIVPFPTLKIQVWARSLMFADTLFNIMRLHT